MTLVTVSQVRWPVSRIGGETQRSGGICADVNTLSATRLWGLRPAALPPALVAMHGQRGGLCEVVAAVPVMDARGQPPSASTASANAAIEVKVQSGVTSAGGAGLAPQPGLSWRRLIYTVGSPAVWPARGRETGSARHAAACP
jgi:hypothetical protein